MKEIISERELLFRSPKKHEFKSKILIGRPYRISDLEWRCDVEIVKIDKPRYSHGTNSLHALVNALSLAQATLAGRMKNGWQIFWPEDKRPTTPEEVFGYDFTPSV